MSHAGIRLLVTCLFAGHLVTSPLYSQSPLNGLFGTDSATDSFYQIDPATGTKSIIGLLDPANTNATFLAPNRFLTPTAMAVRPSDNTIFAWNNSKCRDGLAFNTPCDLARSDNTWELVTIDPLTGEATPVSSAPQQQINALAFDPVTQTLYGVSSSLFTIDTQTGEVSWIGGLGNVFAGADFDDCGNLFALTLLSGELYQIDPMDASKQLIGTLHEGGSPLPYGLLVAGTIAFAPDDTLLGTLAGDVNPGHVLFDIDPVTAEVSNPRGPGSQQAHLDTIQGMGFLTSTPRVCGDEPILVGIDIKPGSDPNCLNVNGHGVIPVAILGSVEFDVVQIDVDSLQFSGLDVRVRGQRGALCSFEDSNGDGFLDLVCHFDDDPTLWEPGEAEACLSGNLLEAFDSTPIAGCDSICVVP